jgi:hypothetical protein
MLITSVVEEVPISGCNLRDHDDTAIIFVVTATIMSRVLVEKPEGKRPLGRPRRRWKDNIKTDLQEMGFGGHGLDRSGCRQGQVTGACECGNEPTGSIQYGEFIG